MHTFRYHTNNNKAKPKRQYFYAVKYGFSPGVYTSWEDCKKQVTGYPKPLFKKFSTQRDAELFISGNYTTTKIDESLLNGLHYDIYNPDNDYPCDTWNRFNNKFYIFTDGSEKKGKNYKISRLGIYLGKSAFNISQSYPNATNNRFTKNNRYRKSRTVKKSH